MITARRSAPRTGAAGARRALAAAGCAALAVGMSACASTEQESAKVARESQLAAAQLAPVKPKTKHHAHTSHNATRKKSG